MVEVHCDDLFLFLNFFYFVGIVFSIWHQVEQCCGYPGEYSLFTYGYDFLNKSSFSLVEEPNVLHVFSYLLHFFCDVVGEICSVSFCLVQSLNFVTTLYFNQVILTVG